MLKEKGVCDFAPHDFIDFQQRMLFSYLQNENGIKVTPV